MKFYPYEKGGVAQKVLVMLKWGHKKFWCSFYTVARSSSHIEGAHQKFPLFKRGAAESFTMSSLGGGGANSFEPAIFHFVDTPPRN